MSVKSKCRAAVVLLLTAFLAMLATSGVGVPPDTPQSFIDRLQVVVNRLALGLSMGLFPFNSQQIWIGDVMISLSSQHFTPRQALGKLEEGFPIAQLTVTGENGIQFSNMVIPPGNYYIILWLPPVGFERFGIQVPPRAPQLMVVKKNGLGLGDFAIPGYYKSRVVPDSHPDMVGSLSLRIEPDQTPCSRPGPEAPKGVESYPAPNEHVVLDLWGLATLSYRGGSCLEFGEPIFTMPTEEELFPTLPPERSM